MTNRELEIRRNKALLRDANEFVDKLGEPEHFVTFYDIYFDIFAIYAEGKGDGWRTTKYRIYMDSSLEPDEMKENSISFEMGNYTRPTLKDQLIRTTIATFNHQDELISYFYDCMDNLVIHEKGWRPCIA